MSVSALSSALVSDLSQQQNPYRQIRQDFRQLASALQNGDLTDAQSAYANIQQVLGTDAGSSNSFGSNTLQNDFAALGQALQSGDLGQAQSAFSQLQSDATGASSPGLTQSDQYVPSQSPIEQALEDYSQLASSLQNNDLTDAQSAYTNLQQLVQAYNGPADSNTSIQNDFTTLGQDLQTNNLTGAQTEFSQLQSDLQAAQNPAQQVQQDYTQLASALQTGNLTGAQSAFSALQQALQTQTGTSGSTATTTGNDPIANDFNALGQALSSGNLTQAQSAFSQLQNDIQAQQSGTSQSNNALQAPPVKDQKTEGHHHHHHHGGGGFNTQSSTSTTTSANNSYTSTVNGSAVNVYA